MTKAKDAALAESDKEAVELSLPRSFADGSETISGYFLRDKAESDCHACMSSHLRVSGT